MTTVSALCAVYNGERYLEAALKSVLAQTRAPEQFLVIDDGSTDASAAIATSLGVRVLREAHRGVALTRNVALEHAGGDLVAWLDADDLWTPDKLAVQVAYMDAHPEVAMTFTHQRLIWEEGVERPYWVRDQMLEGDSPAVATCTMVVRRALFATVGGFNPEKSPSDDFDWIFRARHLGFTHETLPEMLLLRRVHATNISTTMPVGRSQMLGMLRDQVARQRAAAGKEQP